MLKDNSYLKGLPESGKNEKGTIKAWWAWKKSIALKEEEIEVDDLWEDEISSFVETLRDAGLETFVLTETSTALMENIHLLIEKGCTMQGACTVTRYEDFFGKIEEEAVRGIRFLLN